MNPILVFTPNFVRFTFMLTCHSLTFPVTSLCLVFPSTFWYTYLPHVPRISSFFDIGRSVYHFCNIYTFQRDTQCSSTDCLLVLRCQLYMFRTVTVHPQELLFRYCTCRLWYVLIRPAGTTLYQHVP